jgi:hypothetical protein
MLNATNLPMFQSAGVDIADLVYASLTTGTSAQAMIDLVGEEIAAVAIARFSKMQAEQKALAKIRATPNPAQLEEQIADQVLQAGWIAMEHAWRGESYDLVASVRQAQLAYAENHVPAEFVDALGCIDHQSGDRAGTPKGQIGKRVRKWGGKAVNLTVRLDARIASRKGKSKGAAEPAVITVGRSVK